MVDANSAFLFRRRPWMAFSGPAAKISIARVVSVVSRRRFPGFSTIRFSLRTHDGPVGYLRRRGRSRARRWRRRSNANRRNVGPIGEQSDRSKTETNGRLSFRRFANDDLASSLRRVRKPPFDAAQSRARYASGRNRKSTKCKRETRARISIARLVSVFPNSR